ncbi:hypothetical protein NS331_23380 [Pseudacidovorax intermedius]|uniref:Uncharacterized protein n=1 Tax=Pseudacidovorax intermedius TaxID=433924 RepID=A0A147GLV5_9BURK|nr:hypothetical protein NS331_23380 [Pseudacidovorax intermedius]
MLTHPVSDDFIALLLLIEAQAKLRSADEAMQDIIELLRPNRLIGEQCFYRRDLLTEFFDFF